VVRFRASGCDEGGLVPSSPVIQATQEAIGQLHAAAARWGQVLGVDAARAQVETEAAAVARVFEAFALAYGALPRFRTEAALRRFGETLQELSRALQALKVPAAATATAESLAAARQGAERAEAALASLTGKLAEPRDAPQAVRGAVQRLLTDRGYGFVRAEGSTTDIFFNSQATQGIPLASLRIGQTVSFRVVPDPRVPGRMQAIELHVSRAE
jgi:cold shock CspA family protein